MPNIECLTNKDNTLELSYKDKLVRLAAAMIQMPQIECPVKHHFGGGTYTRETHFPAGSVILGKYHRFETVNFLLKGTISVLNTDGELVTLTAPQILVSPPGAKCGYAHDDVIWVNVHTTDEVDLEVIEKKFIDETKDVTLEAHKLLEAIQRKEIELCPG